jgi:hypothetical protein
MGFPGSVPFGDRRGFILTASMVKTITFGAILHSLTFS